jgi:hypothetical protein
MFKAAVMSWHAAALLQPSLLTTAGLLTATP